MPARGPMFDCGMDDCDDDGDGGGGGGGDGGGDGGGNCCVDRCEIIFFFSEGDGTKLPMTDVMDGTCKTALGWIFFVWASL